MSNRLLRRVASLFILLLGVKLLISVIIQLWPRPTPLWARPLLQHRWRQAYRDPERVLSQLGLRSGMRILEIGPGSGLFTTAAAQLIGETGQLFSIDLQIEMLRLLKQNLSSPAFQQVILQAATAEQLPLADHTIDLALVIAVLPMVCHKQQALRELQRVLVPHGMLVVSEDLLEPEYVPAWVTKYWCRTAGFVCTGSMRSWWWYLLTFRSAHSVQIDRIGVPNSGKRRVIDHV